MRRQFWAGAALLLAACPAAPGGGGTGPGADGGPAAGGDGGRDGGPAGDRLALPSSLASTLRRTDGGLPVFATSGAGLPAGVSVSLVYDQTRDDPVTRWAECVSLVRGCLTSRPDAGSPVPCVRALRRCATNAGGDQCCPASCLAAFDTALAADAGFADALAQSLLDGRCVDGFADLVAEPDAGVDTGVDAGVQP